MTEKAVTLKADALPDLDDLLQCPVCYEIPTGQIFQCNEGHHVCGRCKVRLDVCPVCRAFFFGTRNYAMEELIANIRRLRAFKLGGKVTTAGNITPEQQSEAKESTSEENDEIENEDDAASRESVHQTLAEPPRQCSGLFRCLCCKTNPERLPCGRLINHLRYYHSPDLIEGRADENGEYLQAWEFPTLPSRIVTAVRVGTMGLFFLVIEITNDSICTWLVMAASPRVAQEFYYTYTLSGNDREAIFSDCVWSVRTCEGFLKKRQRCMLVQDGDARALLEPETMSAKLRIRRTQLEAGAQYVQPRAVLRVANRSEPARRDSITEELEPFLQDLQNDVARLSRAFATLGREANALVEAEMRSRLNIADDEPLGPLAVVNPPPDDEPPLMSRNARRRLRQRLLHALEANMAANGRSIAAPGAEPRPETNARRTTGRNHNSRRSRITNDISTLGPDSRAGQDNSSPASSDLNMANTTRTNNHNDNSNRHRENTAQPNIGAHSPVQEFAAPIEPAPPVAANPGPPSAVAGTGAGGPAANGNGGRNKKKRRQRR